MKIIRIIRNLYGNKTVSWQAVKAVWEFERKKVVAKRKVLTG